jgi:hypothetical protein
MAAVALLFACIAYFVGRAQATIECRESVYANPTTTAADVAVATTVRVVGDGQPPAVVVAVLPPAVDRVPVAPAAATTTAPATAWLFVLGGEQLDGNFTSVAFRRVRVIVRPPGDAKTPLDYAKLTVHALSDQGRAYDARFDLRARVGPVWTPAVRPVSRDPLGGPRWSDRLYACADNGWRCAQVDFMLPWLCKVGYAPGEAKVPWAKLDAPCSETATSATMTTWFEYDGVVVLGDRTTTRTRVTRPPPTSFVDTVVRPPFDVAKGVVEASSATPVRVAWQSMAAVATAKTGGGDYYTAHALSADAGALYYARGRDAFDGTYSATFHLRDVGVYDVYVCLFFSRGDGVGLGQTTRFHGSIGASHYVGQCQKLLARIRVVRGGGGGGVLLPTRQCSQRDVLTSTSRLGGSGGGNADDYGDVDRTVRGRMLTRAKVCADGGGGVDSLPMCRSRKVYAANDTVYEGGPDMFVPFDCYYRWYTPDALWAVFEKAHTAARLLVGGGPATPLRIAVAGASTAGQLHKAILAVVPPSVRPFVTQFGLKSDWWQGNEQLFWVWNEHKDELRTRAAGIGVFVFNMALHEHLGVHRAFYSRDEHELMLFLDSILSDDCIRVLRLATVVNYGVVMTDHSPRPAFLRSFAKVPAKVKSMHKLQEFNDIDRDGYARHVTTASASKLWYILDDAAPTYTNPGMIGKRKADAYHPDIAENVEFVMMLASMLDAKK